MSGHHFLELDGAHSSLIATVVCDAPPGSQCRMVAACDCVDRHEQQCREAYPDGPPTADYGQCVAAEWINAGDVEEVGAGKTRVPLTLEWDGDGYAWTFDEPCAHHWQHYPLQEGQDETAACTKCGAEWGSGEHVDAAVALARDTVLAPVRALLQKANALEPDDFKTGQDHLPPAFREIDFRRAFHTLARIVDELEAEVNGPETPIAANP